MLKNAETYEIMRPELIGRTRADASGLVMGKHSGRAALAKRLRDLGFTLPDDQLQEARGSPHLPSCCWQGAGVLVKVVVVGCGGGGGCRVGN